MLAPLRLDRDAATGLSRPAKPAAGRPPASSTVSSSKPRARFEDRLTPYWLQYCMAAWGGETTDDVHDVSGVSEPYGPHRAVAERSRVGAALPQPRAAGGLRQAVRPARRGART